MTFEEIQKTIEGMLAVQRQLQESQFELREAQERERETLQVMIEEMNRFIERSNRNERRIEQLIGYSITNESEHLDIEPRFRNLEARLSELENQN
ncbi:hypothetical protein [Crocosphaera subtropica]|nr:hypothetical protein [Crocosphaera subtropica]